MGHSSNFSNPRTFPTPHRVEPYLNIANLTEDLDTLLTKWNVRWVLWPPDYSLSTYLEHDRQWHRVYTSSVAVVFERFTNDRLLIGHNQMTALQSLNTDRTPMCVVKIDKYEKNYTVKAQNLLNHYQTSKDVKIIALRPLLLHRNKTQWRSSDSLMLRLPSPTATKPHAKHHFISVPASCLLARAIR